MTIILNLQILNDLIKTDTIKIMKKRQKILQNNNYYFTPNLGMNLYNAKVSFVNPKFLVLQFCKYQNINLLTLLRRVNDILQTQLKKEHSELFDKDIYSMISEQEDTFTLRCSLPNNKGKYFIKCQDFLTNNE